MRMLFNTNDASVYDNNISNNLFEKKMHLKQVSQAIALRGLKKNSAAADIDPLHLKLLPVSDICFGKQMCFQFVLICFGIELYISHWNIAENAKKFALISPCIQDSPPPDRVSESDARCPPFGEKLRHATPDSRMTTRHGKSREVNPTALHPYGRRWSCVMKNELHWKQFRSSTTQEKRSIYPHGHVKQHVAGRASSCSRNGSLSDATLESTGKYQLHYRLSITTGEYSSMQNTIVIKGAREHNLKNITVSIPRDQITVITGPSGSGKSSLAMDTIYAEGQRRYVESLSAYARQFLEQMQKPEVDAIDGLSPSIAIDQKTISRSPRSTVGTITEIYDYMRVLYARIGRPYCYQCNVEIASQDIENIIQSVMRLPLGSKIQILSPIVRERKGEYKKELRKMRMDGFVRARIDGAMMDLTQDIALKKQSRHTIEIVIDRFIIKHSIEKQLRHAIDTALKFDETVVINIIDEERDILFSRKLACPQCGISYPELDPRLFSFNSKYGACPDCRGLGVQIETAQGNDGGPNDLLALNLEEHDFNRLKTCPSCQGRRLRREALSVKIAGTSIGDFAGLSIGDAESFLLDIPFTDRERIIGARILQEVRDRLSFLRKVGLEYLTLNRPSLTLSGGEAQRIRLATQLGSSLTGVLYVLDEPSIGLHQRDCARLLESLADIRNAGNTVVIVEHDEDTIRSADHVIDMGPGAGKSGGWIVAEGDPSALLRHPSSLTGAYLAGRSAIPVPSQRRIPQGFIAIRGAAEFNLRNLDIAVPLGVFTCVTGVSGSGKSTLIYEILYKALAREISGAATLPGKYREISGTDAIDKVISIDQSPLGRTPRSNPATYSGIFTIIRDLFALLPDAKARGYAASRFSFNVAGGRCESCQGDGLKKIEMHFLPDVYVTCDTCKGRRYNRETLDIRYKNKTIADVLDMTVAEANEFFDAIPPLRQRLAVLEEIGLGYLKLGQPATTLSGGEAQRLRLSRELARTATGKTLYILDEPTTGLHFIDIERLLHVLNRLVEMGNTVVVIEHDMDVIKSADHVIDLGPEGGKNGGKLIAAGTPEQVARVAASHTGQFLARKLNLT